MRQARLEGIEKWSDIAKRVPGRMGKQCRERWCNYLDPSIRKGPWTDEEDRVLVEKQKVMGNKWTQIAKLIPGRPQAVIKNRWNSFVHKKMTKMAREGTSAEQIALTLVQENGRSSMQSLTAGPRRGRKRQPEIVCAEDAEDVEAPERFQHRRGDHGGGHGGALSAARRQAQQARQARHLQQQAQQGEEEEE